MSSVPLDDDTAREVRVDALTEGPNGEFANSYLVGALIKLARTSPEVAAAIDQALAQAEQDRFFRAGDPS